MSNDSVCPTFRKVFVASVFGICVLLIPNGVQSAGNSLPPSIAAPAPGTTLTTSTVTFTGAHTSQDYQHWLYVGSTPTSGNYYGGAGNGNHQFTVSDLPSSGTIYVRYFTRTSNTSDWQAQTHSYTMSLGGSSSSSALLKWAANQESDLAGYRIYHGTTPGNYGNSQTLAKTTTTYQYANLESNQTHYFSVTAIDAAGNESTPSPEVSKAISGPEQLAEAEALQEQQRVAVAEALQEQQRVAVAAKQQEQQRVAVAVKQQEQQRVAKAEKKEQKKLAKAEKKEQKKLAKAEKLLAKIQKALAKIERKLVTHADNPKAVSRLNKKKVKLLAKAEKKEQKKLAKAEKLLAKIQKVLAKIERKLVTHADNPKAVSRLNKKKVMLLAKRDIIQEIYSIN